MARYLYTDHILEAFNVFHRPMELEEVAGYVAEMEAKSMEEVRLAVDNTLTAAWLHGFLSRDDNLFTLTCGYWDDEARGMAHKRHRKYYEPYPERRQPTGGIQDMDYGDQILSAFMVRSDCLTLPAIVSYVSLATNRSPVDVYHEVKVTLELALANGYLEKQKDHVFLLAK